MKAKYLVVMLILVTIMIIFGLIVVHQNYKNRTRAEFLDKKIILPKTIKKPPDIFQNNPYFFFGNKCFLNLTKKNEFTWQIAKNILGILKYQVVVKFPLKELQKLEKQNLLPEFQISLILKKQKKAEILNDRRVTINEFKENKECRFFIRSHKLSYNFQKDNILVFKFKFPENFNSSNISCGITIPRIEKSGIKESNNLHNINLILISIDTLRSDYLGVYKKLEGVKSSFSYSPNLDSFAQTAVIFKNAYSPESATWPALASMLTSKYPCEHGITKNGQQLRFHQDNIATFMLNLGYKTISLMANAFNMQIPGFEEKYDFFSRDFDLINFALKILAQHSHKPFFHWYHFIGVHAAYTPDPWVNKIINKNKKYKSYNLYQIMKKNTKVSNNDLDYIKKLYAGELYQLDFELKKIFDLLKANNIWDRSLIIITSDHGEDLFQHHRNFFHYPSLYNTSLKIPLMIKFPFQDRQIVLNEPVSLIDLPPTIEDYFSSSHQPKNKSTRFSPISLLKLVKDTKDKKNQRVIFAGVNDYKIISLINHEWKFIYNPENIIPKIKGEIPYPYENFELYEVKKDPYEINNVYQKHAKMVFNNYIKSIKDFEKKHNLLKEIKSNFKPKSQIDKQKIIRERLKTLGYIK